MPYKHPLLNRHRWARALAIAALALPMLVVAQPRRPEPQQRQDVRHSHRHGYPVTDHMVERLPPRASTSSAWHQPLLV